MKKRGFAPLNVRYLRYFGTLPNFLGSLHWKHSELLLERKELMPALRRLLAEVSESNNLYIRNQRSRDSIPSNDVC